jgi:hypothetical protein
MNVATTILQQLGGNRFIAMTGAKNLLNGGNYLQFDIGRGAINKANKCRVTLDANDLYTLTFYKWNRKALNMDEVGKVEGVYFDDLQRIFTSETGMDTRI